MAEYSRVLNTTISNFIRGEEVNVLRNRRLPALMKEKGRISFGWSGKDMDWKVRYKQVPLEGYADMDTVAFNRLDQWKTATLDWRGYVGTQVISEKEREMNKGMEAQVKLWSNLAKILMDDLEQKFHEEFYVDGNAAGNDKRLHGIESFMGITGTGDTNGFVSVPSDTYAGLSTTLGNFGGSWTGAWPGTGTGASEYDFWSPIVVDYTDTAWSASTDTWANVAIEAMRFGIIACQRNSSLKGQPDVILLGQRMYREALELMDDKERSLVDRGKGGTPTLTNLGFGNVFWLDGVEVSWEYGLPGTSTSAGSNDVGVGYLFNTSMMELRCLKKQLFEPKGPIDDENTLSYRLLACFFGNLVFNPRFFAKFNSDT